MHSGLMHNAMSLCVCVYIYIFIWPDLQLQSLFPKEEPLSSKWRSPQPMEREAGMVFPPLSVPVCLFPAWRQRVLRRA